jgi:DNA-binding transcriptional ArsR family regulator
MGATKTAQYPKDTLQLARIADALSHPARITIIKTLKEHFSFRNVDFPEILQLSPSSVNRHLQKLKQVSLIDYSYTPHEYMIRLVPENMEELTFFLRE